MAFFGPGSIWKLVDLEVTAIYPRCKPPTAAPRRLTDQAIWESRSLSPVRRGKSGSRLGGVKGPGGLADVRYYPEDTDIRARFSTSFRESVVLLASRTLKPALVSFPWLLELPACISSRIFAGAQQAG